MFCKKCGKQINEDAVFCPFCGCTTSSSESKEKDTERKIGVVSGNVRGEDTMSKPSAHTVKHGNRKLFIFAIIIIVLASLFYIHNSSVEKKLKGYWTASYTYDGYEYINQLEFKESGSGLSAVSSIIVKDDNQDIVYSEGSSFSGSVVIDESNSTIQIENGEMGTMYLHYRKDGSKFNIILDEYWCNGGDPFVENYKYAGVVRYEKSKK